MSWTYVTENSNYGGGAATTITVQLTGVTAGDTIVVGVSWEAANPTSISCSDGTSSLTEAAVGEIAFGGAGDPFSDLFYILSSVASGTVTYTVTFTGASPEIRTAIAQCWTPSAAAALDGTSVGAEGTSTAPNSGNITTTGTDGLAFGWYATWGSTLSSPQINGVAADQETTNGTNVSTLFARTYSSGFTGAASGTITSNRWIMSVLAFGISGGGGRTTKNTRSWPLGTEVGMNWRGQG